MTFEADLTTLLKTVCPRVSADFAPVSTPRPYVTFQGIGGAPLNFLDNGAPGVRLPDVQVNVWADSRIEAMAVIHSIEAAMRAASAFHAHPLGEPAWDFDADSLVFGARQDFGCRHTT